MKNARHRTTHLRTALVAALAVGLAGRITAQAIFQESFDTGVLSAGWVWQADAPVLVTPDANGGGYCASKESLNDVPPPPGEVGSFLFHDLPYAPGASYQVSLDVRVQTTSGIIPGAGCWIGWWSGGNVEEAVSVFTQNADWEFLQSGYGIPAAHQPSPSLRFGVGLIVAGSSVDATAYFDNIQVDAFNFTLPAPVRLNARAWLDGAFVPAQNRMRDDLRAAGLIPATNPYGNGNTVAPAVLAITGDNAVVDWVRVELRIHPENSGAVASAAGLLQRDGDIVAADGSSALGFNAAPGNYHVVVKHRNHLAIMSAAPVTLLTTPTSLDLRLPGTPAYVRGAPFTDQPRKTVGSWATMWSGNVVPDDRLRYTGSGNDRDPILLALGGTTPNNVVSNVYDSRDTNLDGVIKYTGTANDRDIILTNVGGTTPNNTRTQQVP